MFDQPVKDPSLFADVMSTPEEKAKARDFLIRHGQWGSELPEMLGLIGRES